MIQRWPAATRPAAQSDVTGAVERLAFDFSSITIHIYALATDLYGRHFSAICSICFASGSACKQPVL